MMAHPVPHGQIPQSHPARGDFLRKSVKIVDFHTFAGCGVAYRTTADNSPDAARCRLNNWEQQWGAECSSMMFELPHFAVELLVILPCVQVRTACHPAARGARHRVACRPAVLLDTPCRARCASSCRVSPCRVARHPAVRVARHQ
jgi:hypothetical protein